MPSGGVGDGFVDQQNRDVVPNRVDAAAFGALQAFSRFFEQQWLLAYRANQDVQQILRNHASILRLPERDAQATDAGARTPAPAWVLRLTG